MKRIAEAYLPVGLFLIAFLLAGCGRASSNTQADPARSEPPTLADRTYACDAFNVTRRGGPFHGTCDKIGRAVTVTFPDNQSLTVGVDDEVTDDGFVFDIHATDAATHDDWNLTVEDR